MIYQFLSGFGKLLVYWFDNSGFAVYFVACLILAVLLGFLFRLFRLS